jgi:hypothetical protein
MTRTPLASTSRAGDLDELAGRRPTQIKAWPRSASPSHRPRNGSLPCGSSKPLRRRSGLYVGGLVWCRSGLYNAHRTTAPRQSSTAMIASHPIMTPRN